MVAAKRSVLAVWGTMRFVCKQVGMLTSCALGRDGGEHVGLGYLKRKAAASAGLQVTVGGVHGTVVEVPFLRYSLQK